MSYIAEVRVIAACGHEVWVRIADCEYRHIAKHLEYCQQRTCKQCWHKEKQVARLRTSAAHAPHMHYIPREQIVLIPVSDGWRATLESGATAESPSPTGAILLAVAAELESALQACRSSRQ